MAANIHKSWRDCKAWEDEGLRMSTTSNEACKLYDAALSQYVGWYNDTNLNGLDGTLESLLSADPNFLMGRVMANGLELIGTAKTIRLDPVLRDSVESMMVLAKSGNDVTAREVDHARAVQLFAAGYLNKAADVWESILTCHPTDMLAIKFVHDAYFYLGRQRPMRDSVLRILPFWKPSIPLYGFLHGMKAFGLVENGQYEEAEKSGLKGLETNRQDGWSTHSLAHVYDVQGRVDDGIKLLTNTTDWTMSDMLAGHNFWHLGLYYIERGEHEAALTLYDQQIGSKCKPDSMLDLVDAASLLWRLEMEGGVNVGSRWKDLVRLVENHLDDHILSFNDAHISMVLLGSKETQLFNKFQDSLREYVKSLEGNSSVRTGREIGLPLCQALDHFAQGRYDEAASILAPLKPKIIDMGGSDPQRDVFHQVAIHSCMRAKSSHLQNLGREMIYQRKSAKDSSQLTDRLIARYLGSHHS